MLRIDPRGIQREVLSSERKPDGNYIALECGHTARHNPQFMPPKNGDRCFCFHCGEIARQQLTCD